MVKVTLDRRRLSGSMMTEMVVATAILVVAVFPLAYNAGKEQKLFRGCYNRAVATEIVDGEMEVLLAGEWQGFTQGSQNYSPRAFATTNLPPGKFQLTVLSKRLRLEWLPEKRDQGGRVVREATAK